MQLIKRTYHRLYDEILFKRGVKFHGTALSSYPDLDMYLTLAAFHRLKGLPLPKALDRRGGLPWFADIREASRMAQRSQPTVPDNLWDLLIKDLPDHFLKDPSYLVHAADLGNKRNGLHRVSFLMMEIQSISELCKKIYSDDGRPSEDRLGTAEQSELNYWAGQWSRAHDECLPEDLETGLQSLVEAFRAEPDHPQFQEEIILTAALLDSKPVWLTEFRKDRSENLYRIALVAFEKPSVHRKTRLAAHAAREFELFLMYLNKTRRDLCHDFIGSISADAAVMGHSLFRRLVAKKIKELKDLSPVDYEALYKKAQSYPYPTFSREGIVTPGDTLREIGQRIKRKLTRHAHYNT